ncbi:MULTISPECIES: hypothetical protein [Alistipes]|uniref:Uncharacterized protein n=1 Tax=Alistipes putredinis DSM 17216 TaxID=445970 RepID=B0MWQ0_9BACT|nr:MULTISPECIES: hypothetical protein [Alistipes]EDS03299.1 hypothetical protein ALIPUT_01509 [Alistipes putredinis DSM 17216]MBE5688198.1 hypothetical protein [Alistipes sp.]MBE5688954.1 hypothetical protein [Alistipes sp.]MBE5689697.1 hypothetical protein [Alistipes sp.]MBP9567434.1 hypothetical protein [Alistipes sp.]
MIEHQTGVWVSDKAELLLTDKIMMYFEKQSDDAVLVMLKVDSITEDCTLFSKDTIIRQSIPEDFAMKHISSNEIIVNGQKMVKAETIEMCEPYDMTAANDSNALADRLTEWRLGAWVKVDKTTNDIDAAVNTPRNMFVYNIENGMYYLRAARIENVNEGTLFYQNIRLMKNPNTKERTVYFSPNNQNEVLGALEINLDGFKPGTCYFDPNGGIYWSYMSHTPDQIILNGCGGDTYYINRKLAGDKNMFEWIKYTNK